MKLDLNVVLKLHKFQYPYGHSEIPTAVGYQTVFCHRIEFQYPYGHSEIPTHWPIWARGACTCVGVSIPLRAFGDSD